MVSCQMNRQQDITLKRISHFDEIFITGCTWSCQLPVQPVMKISSKWHFHFSVPKGIIAHFTDTLCVTSMCEIKVLLVISIYTWNHQDCKMNKQPFVWLIRTCALSGIYRALLPVLVTWYWRASTHLTNNFFSSQFKCDGKLILLLSQF